MITLKPLSQTKTDKYYSSLEVLYKTMQSIPNKKVKDGIFKLLPILESELKESYSECNKRINEWSGMLNKYYHLDAVKVQDNGVKCHINALIYPYMVISANETLWCLQVNLDDDYTGGVKDTNYDLSYLNEYTITLTEISKDEFEFEAKNMVTKIINRRLNIEIGKKNEKHNYTFEETV